jgi:pimeloyl-ACP methyl ester carboxylesterase
MVARHPQHIAAEERFMSSIPSTGDRPTVVLVHGAFAESSSFNAVIAGLHKAGITAVAAANPLRGVAGDAAYVSSIVQSIEGPVVLVGHSYGGAVISNVTADEGKVTGMVFLAGFATEEGETSAGLSGKFPGSTLGPTLTTVALPDGGTDLYIKQEDYQAQFAADTPDDVAAAGAVTQRPIAESALNEPSGEPLWKSVPSWFAFSDKDLNIPVEAHRFMAERAGSQRTLEFEGASHSVPVSRPDEVVEIILQATGAPAAAPAGAAH